MNRAPAALAAILLIAPSGTLASNYFSIAADRSALSITDLRSPRLTGVQADTFEIVLYRSPTKAKRGKADYVINKIDIDCSKNKVRRFYSASYSLDGKLVDNDARPTAWAAIKPDSKQQTLQALGCLGAAPRKGFSLGDVRVGQALASYRAGAYDRFIH